MKTVHGIAASGGYAVGEAFCYTPPQIKVVKTAVQDLDAEISRLCVAVEKTSLDLRLLYEQSVKTVGEEAAAIFEIHGMMLTDQDYQDCLLDVLQNEKICAEYAVSKASERFEKMLEATGDDYMKERAVDVRDICFRLLCKLTGQENTSLQNICRPVIVLADDLMPSDTVNIDKRKVLAFVTGKGSKVSHTAILARGMGIPAVVGIRGAWKEIKTGSMLTVDGCKGIVCVEPDEEQHALCVRQADLYRQEKDQLLQYRNKPSVTADGIAIEVAANISRPQDVKEVLDRGAEGIGLFRSEFLYMESLDFPSEEEQYKAYSETLRAMGNRRVIIRTLDLGADKHLPYFPFQHEENPAMGLRAIRVCMERPDVFKPQLRALLRASVFGRLGILFPMITSVKEVLAIREMLDQVKSELESEGIPWSSGIELGVMIETPAAVLISDFLAAHVDFFSIGTNDLTQYMLAVDRMNETVHDLYDYTHTAVLRAVRIVTENARANGIWVGVCGESAADTELTAAYLAMGVTELSVAPSSILEVRKAVCGTTIKDTNISF